MGHSRRFLNLIVDSRIPGVRTLSRIDLTRQQLFYPAPPPPPNGNGSESAAAQADAGNEASTMGRIRLSPPSVTFRASAVDNKWRIHCFPLAYRRVLCADQSGRTFLFDADTRHVATMPSLHKPKRMPFSLFVPGASADSDSDSNSDSEAGWDTEDNVGDGVGSLFVMDGWPDMEPSYSDEPSNQFEAYIYRQRSATTFKSWQCQLLPPPPYVRDPMWRKLRPKIVCYAVVGGGSQILISADGAGTYCMDTVSHTWSQVGKWMLPFYAKVEYVPELKLWFGFSAKDQLSAADLSTMDSKPRLVGTWCKEFDPPKEWRESQEPQLVSLGSGRFCIARFFHTTTEYGYYGDEVINRAFAVFTGVEVVPRVYEGKRAGNGSSNGGNGNSNASGSGNDNGNSNGSSDSNDNGKGNGSGNGGKGKVKLRMIKHMSRCHTSTNGTTIESVF